MSASRDFNEADEEAIRAHGLELAEVERQLDLLRHPPGFRLLDRAAAPGDGIRQLSAAEVKKCHAAFARGAEAGRFLSFVPASGAASRMFKSLMEELASGRELTRAALEARKAEHPAAADVLRACEAWRELACAEPWAAALAARGLDAEALVEEGNFAPLLHALLDPDGLNYPDTPKGLLPFHAYPDGSRTAFEEHLEEAARLLRAGDGGVRLHFTVAPAHQGAFAETLHARGPAVEARHDARLEVGFSTQDPATDTIATDGEGQPFRQPDGRLLFRPGGHGALLRNLEGSRGEFVFIKNIDNIVPDDRRDAILHWRRALGGLLIRLREESTALAARLASGEAGAETAASTFLAKELGENVKPGQAGAALEAILRRPMRVCGVVRNTGDPGGGPFWVQGRDGRITRQVVETAEIDAADPDQHAILDGSTHFNPTDMVCSLRDAEGKPFALQDYLDPSAVFIAEKSSGGRDLRALEHPGLWNGSMANWTTVFVEVPREIFQPVKAILDLLGPGHGPRRTNLRVPHRTHSVSVSGMETMLVTGGAGFIGANFVRVALASTDARIVILDKLTYAGHRASLAECESDPRVEFVHGDIADRDAVRALFRERRPRWVLNFAAESHVDRSIDGPREFIESNTIGAFELLEAARAQHENASDEERAAFRFLHVSTDEVYGSLGSVGAFSETTPYAPNSPYSASKAAADHLVRAWFHTFGLPTLITNCSNNYGPFQYPEKLVPLMLLNALEGKELPIYGDGGNIRDWIFVEDHCEGILRVLQRGRPGEKYNLGGGGERTNLQIVDLLCSLLEEIRPAAENEALRARGIGSYAALRKFVTDRPGHDRRYAIDGRKVARELDWQPGTSVEDGFRRTVAWYLNNPQWCAQVQADTSGRQRIGLGAKV